jgi:hypothetical protein
MHTHLFGHPQCAAREKQLAVNDARNKRLITKGGGMF